MTQELSQAPIYLLRGLELGSDLKIIPWEYDFNEASLLMGTDCELASSSNPLFAMSKSQKLFEALHGTVQIRSDCWTQEKRMFWITLDDQSHFTNSHDYYHAYLPKIIEVFGPPTSSDEDKYFPRTDWMFQDGISVSWNVQERFVYWVNFVVSKKFEHLEPRSTFLKRLFRIGN